MDPLSSRLRTDASQRLRRCWGRLLPGRAGGTPEVAFERIAHSRGCAVPDTPEQREWVRRFSERHWSAASGRPH